MMAASPAFADPRAAENGRGDLVFTDQDFSRIAAYAYREFGLNLQSSKKDLVYSRLVRRVRHLSMPDFASYCQVLDSADGTAEHDHVVSALTTNVTHFFREGHHFDLLAKQVLTPRLAKIKAGQRMRIWSAGCSSGMEPYSIAMTVLDLVPDAGQLNIRVLATDVDPAILDRAREARFTAEEVRPIPERMRPHNLGPAGDRGVQILPRVSQMVRFAELNLMQDWPLKGPFDAIFCRNVAIYFDKPTQARLWHRFAGLLAPGGVLFIGHSERLSGTAESAFRSMGVTAYQRTETPLPPDFPRKDA